MKYRFCILLALLPACGGSRRRPVEPPDVMVDPAGSPDAGAGEGVDGAQAPDAPLAVDARPVDTAPDLRAGRRRPAR